MRRLAPAALTALALAGCGAPSKDLFAVERSGEGAGAELRLVVSDGGTVSCNGASFTLPPERLLDARRLARELVEPVELSLELPADEQTTFRYVVRMDEGTARFADTSPDTPEPLLEAAGFTRLVAKSVCRLPR